MTLREHVHRAMQAKTDYVVVTVGEAATAINGDETSVLQARCTQAEFDAVLEHIVPADVELIRQRSSGHVVSGIDRSYGALVVCTPLEPADTLTLHRLGR